MAWFPGGVSHGSVRGSWPAPGEVLVASTLPGAASGLAHGVLALGFAPAHEAFSPVCGARWRQLVPLGAGCAALCGTRGARARRQQPWQKPQVTTACSAQAGETNRGIDPTRLLGALRSAGIGKPRKPTVPDKAELLHANTTAATQLLVEERRTALEKGEAGIRPMLARRRQRLPLLVKYHKPAGLLAIKRSSKRKNREDLRSVISAAGDRFELDLYHPVPVGNPLRMKESGLLLWSRSKRISRELKRSSRGVVHCFDAKVAGVVEEDALREALRAGVQIGVAGFEKTRYADVQEARYMPDSPLQAPLSMVRIAVQEGKSPVGSMLKACGHPLVHLKRTQVGKLALGDLPEGGLEAASPEEEAWACGLAGLEPSEYPPGVSTDGARELAQRMQTVLRARQKADREREQRRISNQKEFAQLQEEL